MELIARKLLLCGKTKKVLSRAHVRSLKQRATNDPNIQTLTSNAALCLSQFQLGTSPGQLPGILSKKLAGGRDLTFESCPGAGNSTRVGILWKVQTMLNAI